MRIKKQMLGFPSVCLCVSMCLSVCLYFIRDKMKALEERGSTVKQGRRDETLGGREGGNGGGERKKEVGYVVKREKIMGGFET